MLAVHQRQCSFGFGQALVGQEVGLAQHLLVGGWVAVCQKVLDGMVKRVHSQV